MTSTEPELLADVAGDLDDLSRLDLLRQRDPILARLKSIHDAAAAADHSSPVVEWLGLEHQVGTVIFAATGLNKTEPRLRQAWSRWLQVTTSRVAGLRASSADRVELASWTQEAEGHKKDPLSILNRT